MLLKLYVAYDKVSKRYFDVFTGNNDAQVVRNRLPLHQRMLMCMASDIEYYAVGSLDDESGAFALSDKVLVDFSCYKFPETVSMSISEYNDLQSTLRAFNERVDAMEKQRDEENAHNGVDVKSMKKKLRFF